MTCTGCNTESVAEHAISLFFATRRSLISVHNALADFGPGRPNEWKSKGEYIRQNGALHSLFWTALRVWKGDRAC